MLYHTILFELCFFSIPNHVIFQGLQSPSPTLSEALEALAPSPLILVEAHRAPAFNQKTNRSTIIRRTIVVVMWRTILLK